MLSNFYVPIIAIVIGGVIVFLINSRIESRNRGVITRRYIFSLLMLILLYSGMYIYLKHRSELEVSQSKQFYLNQIKSVKNEQSTIANQNATIEAQQKQIEADNSQIDQQKIELDQQRAQLDAQNLKVKMMEENFTKDQAFSKWKDTIFSSSTELNKSLARAKTKYKLTPVEVKKWQETGEKNLSKRLTPNVNSQEVMMDYQSRLRNGLTLIKENHTLLAEDIRGLTESINAVRLVGKEYEKILSVFKELYDNISATGSDENLQPPKQSYFLFFPVKQKEYNQLLSEFHESKGNQKASKEFAAKLKKAIETVEEEFKQLNKKFDDNISFLDNKSNSMNYNADKLKNLIETALREIEIISQPESTSALTREIEISQPQPTPAIKVIKTPN